MDVFLRLLNALLMIGLPLGLGTVLARKLRVGWRLFGIGALTFVASQVLHLPFNFIVLAGATEQLRSIPPHAYTSLALIALLFGLSAGVFEEVARYVVFRVWLKYARTPREALMVGAGHGGSEAILLGGLAAYGFFQALAFREADLSMILPPGQLAIAQARLDAYWMLPPLAALLGTVERIFALCFHVSASLLVLQAFIRRNLAWLALAILWHALLDGSALVALKLWGIYPAEGMIGVMALLSLGIVFALLRRDERWEMNFAPPAVPPKAIDLSVGKSFEDVAEDRLEDSRYV